MTTPIWVSPERGLHRATLKGVPLEITSELHQTQDGTTRTYYGYRVRGDREFPLRQLIAKGTNLQSCKTKLIRYVEGRRDPIDPDSSWTTLSSEKPDWALLLEQENLEQTLNDEPLPQREWEPETPFHSEETTFRVEGVVSLSDPEAAKVWNTFLSCLKALKRLGVAEAEITTTINEKF